MVKATVTTNVLCSDLTPEGYKAEFEPVLGPTLKTEVQVEGQTVRALIDTGSPISLVSIDFLLQALKALIETVLKPGELAKALKRG